MKTTSKPGSTSVSKVFMHPLENKTASTAPTEACTSTADSDSTVSHLPTSNLQHDPENGFQGNESFSDGAANIVLDTASFHEPLNTAGAAEKNASAFNPLIAGIGPFQPGLIIVSVPSSQLLAPARNAFTCLVLEKSSVLGIPVQDHESVFSVYSGNPRQLEQAQLFAAANPLSTTSVPHASKTCCAQDKLDWTSNEGLHLLLPTIEGATGWVICEQPSRGQITPAMSQGIIQIGNAAKTAGVWVVLILVCPGELQKSQLSHVCDEYIEVAQCEPDIGIDMAFSIDCVGIRDMNSHGIGKVMCSVKLADGVFHRRYDPYISACFETRIMWILRGQGKTLEEIGSILKKDKSTILRRLQGLPVPRRVEMGPDWLERNLA